MLRPSYTELMDKINENKTIDSKVTSRYTIVVAAAKRARQLIDGAEALADAETDKAVSVAVNEMSDGLIFIKVNNEDVSIKERENYVMETGDGYMAYQLDDLQYSDKPKSSKKYDGYTDDDEDPDDNDDIDDDHDNGDHDMDDEYEE